MMSWTVWPPAERLNLHSSPDDTYHAKEVSCRDEIDGLGLM